MSHKLTDIALQLINANKKVQLIYAFNGTGKTRLSMAFKELIVPKHQDDEESVLARNKILYYNAFTEDLFYWDNNLQGDTELRLKIQPNFFTDWLIQLLIDLGEYDNIITNYQRLSGEKVTPRINEEYTYKYREPDGKITETTVPAFSEVIFQVAAEPSTVSDDARVTTEGHAVVDPRYETIKISKGEESNFVWSIFYTLLEQVIFTLDESNVTNRATREFDQLEYVFIDDPVTSLDENHLIELAVNLAGLIKTSASNIKFVVTTHNPLFYNVLYNELNNKLYKKQPDGSVLAVYKPDRDFQKYRLNRDISESFRLEKQPNDSPFSYHLYLLSEIQKAILAKQVKKYHFNFVRNILEKLATFLGYNHWPALLPKSSDGKPDPFINRILNLSSHSAHAGEEIADIEESDKEKLEDLIKFLTQTYGFKRQEG